jgi:hypothetical protein
VWARSSRACVDLAFANWRWLVDIEDMTTDAAALAVIIALMVGYYFARWRRRDLPENE